MGKNLKITYICFEVMSRKQKHLLSIDQLEQQYLCTNRTRVSTLKISAENMSDERIQFADVKKISV